MGDEPNIIEFPRSLWGDAGVLHFPADEEVRRTGQEFIQELPSIPGVKKNGENINEVIEALIERMLEEYRKICLLGEPMEDCGISIPFLKRTLADRISTMHFNPDLDYSTCNQAGFAIERTIPRFDGGDAEKKRLIFPGEFLFYIFRSHTSSQPQIGVTWTTNSLSSLTHPEIIAVKKRMEQVNREFNRIFEIPGWDTQSEYDGSPQIVV